MYRVYTRRERTVEHLCTDCSASNPDAEQSWRRYASSVLWFSAVSMVLIYVLIRAQSSLPLNPAAARVDQYVSFNTASSFMTNTNWQSVRRRGHHELSQPDARA